MKKCTGEMEVELHVFPLFALDTGGQLASLSGPCTRGTHLTEGGVCPGRGPRAMAITTILVSTRNRTQSVRLEASYRLSCPGSYKCVL